MSSYSHLPYGKRPQNIQNAKSPSMQLKREIVDHYSSLVRYMQVRHLYKNTKDIPTQLGKQEYQKYVQPQNYITNNPAMALCTKNVGMAKNRDAVTVINCVRWAYHGRRVVLGCHSGEILLWRGFTFNFDLRTQCHSASIRSMEWTHNGQWIISGDESGTVKYIEPSLNVVQYINVRNDPIRGISISPSDSKFVTACDDTTLSFIDFETHSVERTLMPHGSDVKTVAWHPLYSLVLSGGKDKCISATDPRSGNSLFTIHGAHRMTVSNIKWNHCNTNWFATCGRDSFVKVWDLRMLQPFLSLRGHRKDVNVIDWHPLQENLLVSAGNDKSIFFWSTYENTSIAEITNAHELSIWDLHWHPMGNILTSGSSDLTAKFWTQNLPGDDLQDKYNMSTPAGIIFRNSRGNSHTHGSTDTSSSVPGLDINSQRVLDK